MATSAQELERLVVRLVGEGSAYKKVLDDAVTQTVTASAKIEQITDKNMGAANHAMREAVTATAAVTHSVQGLVKAEQKAVPATAAMSYELEELISYELQSLPVTDAMAREYKKLARAEAEVAATTATATTTTKAATVATASHWERIKTLGDTTQRVGNTMRGFGTMMSLGVTLPIVGAGIAAIKMAADLETVTIQFETLLGADKGAAILKRLKDFADVTPFHFESVAAAGRALLAFGLEQKYLMPTMRMLGDVSSGTGKDLNELAVIFGRIKSTGRVEGEELRQLSMAGFDLSEMAKVMGTSVKGLYKKVEEGRVPFGAFQETMRRMTSEGGRFYGLTEKLGQSTAGQWSTLTDNAINLGQAFGKELLPVAKDFMAALSTMMGWFQQLSPGWKRFIIYTLAATAAIGPLIAVCGTMVSAAGAMVSVFSFLGVSSLPALLSGFAAVTAAIIETLVVAAPLTFVIGIVALAVAMLTDMLTGGKLGLLDWVYSWRIGTYKIETWFTACALEVYKVWDTVATFFMTSFFDMVYQWNEWGQSMKRVVISVAQSITAAFMWAATRAVRGISWLVNQVIDGLNYLGVLSDTMTTRAHNGARDVVTNVEDLGTAAGNAYQEAINKSLTDTERRWDRHSQYINGLEKDHANAIKDYGRTEDDAFRKDTDAVNKQMGDAVAHARVGAKLPGEEDVPKWNGSGGTGDKKEHNEFKQVAINRISLAGLTGFTRKIDEVKATGVEHRLDSLIAITKMRQQQMAPVLTD